jgi:predicted metalloendopeptidase
MPAPFGIGIEADTARPDALRRLGAQGGLGMPDRDYYLDNTEAHAKYRAAYKAYVTKIFELLGDNAAASRARHRDRVRDRSIAKGHWTQEELRVPDKAFKAMDALPRSRSSFPTSTGKAFAAGLRRLQASNMVAYGDTPSRPAPSWSIRSRLTRGRSISPSTSHPTTRHLTKAFDDARFEFFSKTLRGVSAKRDRWKRGVQLLDGNIGEALGEAYAAKFFPPENKAKMEELVGNLHTRLKPPEDAGVDG